MRNPLLFFVFIIIVIGIYSLLNYYFIKKHRNILTGKSLPVILLRLLLITIILTPIATMVFSYRGLSSWAAVTGFTGYGWLAFLFLFLMINGLVDIILFIAEKLGFVTPGYMAREILLVTMVISISILGYGFYEASTLDTERVTVVTDKLADKSESIRIMQLSDIHFSPLISVEKARLIKSIADRERPDIIVSTGDFLDRSIRNSDEVAAVMRTLDPPFGKFAITGNHEYITGLKESISFIEKSGFVMLRNSNVSVAGINLVGVDDLSAASFGAEGKIDEKKILSAVSNGYYTILLKHQPKIFPDTADLFDLQLSGHTHAGQIFPFTLLVKLAFPYLCGEYHLTDGRLLYVSRGTGTWGPPVRFLASPEVTIIEIRRK